MIDPKLLQSSSVKELKDSYDLVQSRFRSIFQNLEKCKSENDRFWRAAFDLTDFSELKGVSLGYSVTSKDGKGWASTLRSQVLRSARKVVNAGLKDPEFFELLAIFEPGIGADRISDMIGTILIGPLCAFTKRVCKALDIKMKTFAIKGLNYQLPFIKDGTGGSRYIILVPSDILTDISMGLDRDAIAAMIMQNAELRQHINNKIGSHWRSLVESSRGKETTREALFGDIRSFKDMIERYRDTTASSYDFRTDPNDVAFWYGCVRNALQAQKPKLTVPAKPTLKSLTTVASKMALYFKQSIEERGLREALFSGGTHRSEKSVQAVLFAIVETLCEENGLKSKKNRATVELCAEASNHRVAFKLKFSNSKRLINYFDDLLETNRKSSGFLQSLFVVCHIQNTAVNVARLKAYVATIPSSVFKPELIIIKAYEG